LWVAADWGMALVPTVTAPRRAIQGLIEAGWPALYLQTSELTNSRGIWTQNQPYTKDALLGRAEPSPLDDAMPVKTAAHPTCLYKELLT